ncbi:MAG TPA: VOC family protein [Lacunisphaera sp.]|jgi:catechol 2,3-dioxygenase-like lactoylglutathione lyase family enzyme|nr:VOC family protein [Lacunisphaera sp.]
MKTKSRITGIGGIFMRAKSPQKLAAWYRRHLGLPVDDQWFGWSFEWRDAQRPKQKGCTVWSLFAPDAKQLGSPRQGHMVNYRVANLKKVVAALKKERVWIDPKGIEASDFGKFAWIKDGEGNRIELWEPPEGM